MFLLILRGFEERDSGSTKLVGAPGVKPAPSVPPVRSDAGGRCLDVSTLPETLDLFVGSMELNGVQHVRRVLTT